MSMYRLQQLLLNRDSASGDKPKDSRSLATLLFRHLLLLFIWLGLWRVAVLMEYAPHASIWFPPAGLSFAAFLVMGLRALPVLMVGSILSTFWVDNMYQMQQGWQQLLYSGLMFGFAHCMSYWLGAALLRRWIGQGVSEGLPRMITGFLVLGALTSLLAALTGTQILAASGMIGMQEAGSIWLPWWIGDLAGTLVLTPLFIGLLSWRYPDIQSWLGGLNFQASNSERSGFIGKLALCASLLSLIMLLASHFPYPEVSFAVFFLIIPQMWIVCTESAFRAAISLAVFSILTAVWVASLGLMDQALVYQFAICVIAASAYFGLAVPVLMARNQMLQRLAFRDSLTGIMSRQHFFDQAGEEIRRSHRYRHPVSLLLFDIDHFKQINDQFGHACGDEVLQKAASCIEQTLRESDLFGRFGGDEFMLLLPNIDFARAVETAERLRRLLGDIRIDKLELRLSGSFGAIQLQQDETLTQALERVDSKLLQAKRAGRNRVN
ncbi:sensor domain-containing diguanylate cyclase [Bowmanella dokdonensis]|uniref:diguanylate cyclase n=1 Tax=Bowmanella dokdonensis TaxID=751969 RepID=A0A939IPD5_9ALTE|nr:diguanylate cyclase [Bowmanella dokdonensis]MBN7823874.1 sensor domain-containing diguanylate cyclase [Bowmanella dokdonensis]